MTEIQNEIDIIESQMNDGGFWADKKLADEKIKRLRILKDKLLGSESIDKGNAILTIIAGAGGDDSEDFAYMLYQMYVKYLTSKGYTDKVVHEHYNEHNGIKNITIEIIGKNAYSTFKNESGVHRLVRVSPFNAAGKRHTSFALVEVVPVINDNIEVNIRPDDIDVITQKSGGPGGQNVNKRETSVRVIHKPTGLSVHVSAERTQEANRDKAMKLIRSKLYKLEEDNAKKLREGYQISKTVDIEWGNQIRNYVMNPYKLVKDLRTGIETTDIDGVFSGDIEAFIYGEKEL